MFNELFSKLKKKSSKEQETSTQFASGAESEERSSGNYLKKGCIIVLIILLLILSLLLLALFYPVKKTKKDVDLLKRLREKTAGESRYDIISAKLSVFPKETGLSNKPNFLIVEFKVENIAKKSRILDYSMVRARAGGMEFIPSEKYTDKLYESLREKSPWNIKILPYAPTKAYVVFVVPVGPKGFKLLARDFDWTTSKSITLDLGI